HVDGLEAPVFPERAVDGRFGASGSRRLTLLAFGQSNAANSGDGLYSAAKAACVFNVFDMKFYAAIDPLPGASNDGAAVWTRLADKLLEAGVYSSIVLVPIAVGGSVLKDWAPGG